MNFYDIKSPYYLLLCYHDVADDVACRRIVAHHHWNAGRRDGDDGALVEKIHRRHLLHLERVGGGVEGVHGAL